MSRDIVERPVPIDPNTFAALVERAAQALAMHDFRHHSPRIRWPSDAKDTLSGRDGTVPVTWGYAGRCREIARVILADPEILAALREKERIVVWLRSDVGKGSEEGADYADAFADAIERGEHLKGTDHAG